MRLANKVAVVTGAAAGIGLAVAQAFAKDGARVVLSDADAVEALRARLRQVRLFTSWAPVVSAISPR